MVSASSMATRSSLELMLDKIQQLDERPSGNDDEPPSLPVRPVSRARLPRSRKALKFDFRTKFSEGIDVESCFSRAGQEDIAESEHFNVIDRLENPAALVDKQISNIQKCYRGHQVRCYYRELRRGVIALQSFARGENARKEFQSRFKRLMAIILIQKHTRMYIQHRMLNEQHAAVTPLHSGIQEYPAQRHFNGMINEPKSRYKKAADETDHTQVPYSVIVDLQKRVLRTEAKVREKEEENVALKTQLQEIEKKRQQYEERMKSMEKSWQDQLKHIQNCLAAAKKNPTPLFTIGQFLSIREHYNQHEDSNVVTTEVPNGRSLDCLNTSTTEHVDRLKLGNNKDSHLPESGMDHKFHPEEELQKLKLRFKAWKKDYRNKLREAHSAFKKLGHSETAKKQRNWWGRLPY